jgi:hypothetical protein
MVECVNAKPRPEFGVCNLVIGELYTVTMTVRGPMTGALIVRVDRAAHHPATLGFYATRFRKVYRPKADLIERLMSNPVDGVPA